MLCVDWDEREQRLIFEQEGEGAVLPIVPATVIAAGAQAARATGGKSTEAPPVIAAREAQAPIAVSPLVPVPAPTGRRKSDS